MPSPDLSEVWMLNDVLEVLSAIGVLPAIQFMVVAGSAIYIYRYFVDRA